MIILLSSRHKGTDTPRHNEIALVNNLPSNKQKRTHQTQHNCPFHHPHLISARHSWDCLRNTSSPSAVDGATLQACAQPLRAASKALKTWAFDNAYLLNRGLTHVTNKQYQQENEHVYERRATNVWKSKLYSNIHPISSHFVKANTTSTTQTDALAMFGFVRV